jgi:DNA-directed RNA polymerase subunit M/transcription elongation factor TFIIS
MTDLSDKAENKNINETNFNHNFSLDAEFYKEPYNNIRILKLLLLSDSLSLYEKFNQLNNKCKNNIIKKIENSCYTYTLSQSKKNNIILSWDDNTFEELYHMSCYKILSNINQDFILNDNFINKILNNKLNLDKIAYLSSREIFPEKYIKIDQNIEKRKNVKQTINTSRMYICGRCGNNETTLESIQMRSLDEGNSIFATCVDCGKKWQVA